MIGPVSTKRSVGTALVVGSAGEDSGAGGRYSVHDLSCGDHRHWRRRRNGHLRRFRGRHRHRPGRRAERVAGHVTGENRTAEHLTDRRIDDAGAGGFFLTDEGTFVTFDGTPPRQTADFHARFTGSDGRLVSDADGWRYRTTTADGLEERDPPTEGYDDDHERTFENAAAHAVALLEGTVENRSPGWQACHTLEVLAGFYVSDATGGRVSVPLADPLTDVTITSW